jgi:hypothetical protein
VTAQHFKEEYSDELLRASLVMLVAAMDRYCHDLILEKVVRRLASSTLNKELRSLAVPAHAARAAVLHAKKPKSRPMLVIRAALQESLHYDTFQRPDDLLRCSRLIGVDDLWTKCGKRLKCQKKDIPIHLHRFAERRNKIVHEADIVRHKKGGKLTRIPISAKQVAQDIIWLSDLIEACDAEAHQPS